MAAALCPLGAIRTDDDINICMAKELYCSYKIILKNMHKSKMSHDVYVLSSKQTYRPTRARVLAQLFQINLIVTFHLKY